MRFTEIANPEEQLALWKLVSDKMWAAFGQQAQQPPIPMPTQQLATSTPKTMAKPISHRLAKPQSNRKATKVKVHKPKKAPMAPAPKPLPKPQPQQLTPTQAAKQQTQQHQKIAQHLNKEITKSNPQQKIHPQLPTPIQKAVTPIEPMTNGYDEREKDELVMHSRAQHPFKTVRQLNSAFSGQKRGF